MAKTNETQKSVPPYLSFNTFLSFTESIATMGMPDQIDKSIMRKYVLALIKPGH